MSRAIPNQRLVRAFQIDNGFTTKDEDYGREFRKEAITHIGDVTRGGWNRIGECVQMTASATFEQYKDRKSAHLDVIIQVVTLKMIIFLLFDLHPDVIVLQIKRQPESRGRSTNFGCCHSRTPETFQANSNPCKRNWKISSVGGTITRGTTHLT